MDDDTSKHECKDPGAMSCPTGSSHDRRASTFTGANALTTNLEEQQSQLTLQNDTSQASRHSLGIPCTPDTEAGSPSPSPTTPTLPSSTNTPDEIDAMLQEIIWDKMGDAAVTAYFEADFRPPITQESLGELDMPRIINNPKLRHDVNFDRELHFRPNLDGAKGKQKQKQAGDYWKALEVELYLCTYVRTQTRENPGEEADWNRVLKQSLRRLEGVFKTIREIMKTLVPDYDQKAVDERLDVDHVMQQIQRGVCDLIDLANWLAKILKRHCAPMRDSLVDGMRREIEDGVHENENARLVRGLSQLMTILEAMKLDVANHQIRHMRPLLIADTVNFQRKYNQHRIKLDKIKPHDSKYWLEVEMDKPTFTEAEILNPLDACCSALLRDVVFNSEELSCPPAFYLDADRLQALRIELHSMTYHELCRGVFQELAEPTLGPAQIANAYESLHGAISSIVGTRGKFGERADNLAAEMVRVLTPPPFDEALLSKAETLLRDRLRTDSESFRHVARGICGRVLPKLWLRVAGLAKKTAMDLHDDLVPITISRNTVIGFGAICEPAPLIPLQPADPDDDLVRRMAHMLVLHWQVWWDLVYLIEDGPQDDDDDVVDVDDEAGSPGSSRNVPSHVASNTVPVAQAVYAPGRKWLPVAVCVTDVPNQLPTPSPTPPPGESQAPGAGGGDQNGDEASNVDSEQQRQPA